MKIIIPDMDDISLDNPDANGLNWAFYLKGKFPRFKITLFAIPGRSTYSWLDEIARLPWIELAVHGNTHDKEERITQEMVDNWSSEFQTIYKGPDHFTTDDDRHVLARNGYKIVDKTWLDNPYVIHGHCWIKADWERLMSQIEADTVFKFISEVI